ncbi:MAG: nucleotide sugar dehydrogenase [Parachlamydiales bacterium]|nr:nucleotide sugar dehydrogenase [Parachlamydiales bacterium]
MPITLEKIKAKQVTVGVVGLGYVGLPLSLVFADANVKIIGFDIDLNKIKAIDEGRSYIRHIASDRLKNARSLFHATVDFKQIAQCDAVIICVPTPLDQHLEPDLRYIVDTSEAIAPHLQPHTLVSLESTTWPGTTEEVMKPILEKTSLKLGQDLYLCFSPEREDPGNKSFNTKTIPKLVGGANKESLDLAVALYGLAIEHVVPLSGTRVAECAKLFENIFRSVNIALVNELKIICEAMGIDVWEVIHAAQTKPFGFMPFWPGPGLGGHCIPIDPFYLTWKAKEFGLRTRFIELAGEINRAMPKYVIDKVQDCLNTNGKPLKGSKVLILGLSYKSDIDDMRESPSLKLIELLESKGAIADYYDPYIPVIPPTREHAPLTGRKSEALSNKYDCFILATKHSCFSKEEILSHGVPVVDTRNFLPKCEQVVQA